MVLQRKNSTTFPAIALPQVLFDTDGRFAGGLMVFVELATNDPAEEIRRHAVEIIGHRRDASMIPTLERLLSKESSPDVQQRLRRAIRELSK